MKRLPARTYVFVVLGAISCLLVSCFTYGNIKDRMTKTFPVDPGGTLTLESDTGSIAVQGADIDSVDVEILFEVKTADENRAQKILEDYDIQFSHRGDDVSIEAKYKKEGINKFWNTIGQHLRVKFIIAVPSEYNVDLNTKGGSISVENLHGRVLSKTSGGSLKFDKIEGSVSGKTSGGSISIGEVVGSSNIHTSGGSITVEEVLGTIKAHTSGGSVKATISRQPDSDCRLTTSGGSITVYLSESLGFILNAETSGGRINTDFPVSLKGKVNKRSLRGEMNGGGPELYLRTSGGSIYLKNL